MRRGEVWTQSGGAGYAGKPRPVLIVQSDLLADVDSVVTCLFTTHDRRELPTRVPVAATPANGLMEDSELMADKIMAVARNRLGKRIGTIDEAEMARVETALALVLGFAG